MAFRGFLAVFVLALAAKTSQGAGFSYDANAANGPSHWADLDGSVCGGSSQSPIDLESPTHDDTLANFVPIRFDAVDGISWTLLNNGHTLQVNFAYDSADKKVQVSGGSLGAVYTVAQFHFHWGSVSSQGSEHTVDGSMYPMEVHIVTYKDSFTDLTGAVASSDSDALAVLGFFFEVQSDDNPQIKTIIDNIASVSPIDMGQTSKTHSLTSIFALNDFVASMQDYYRYSGSLTTPTCNEIVTWTVFRNTIKISESQLALFRTLKDASDHSVSNNYRPVQSLGGRTLKSTWKVSGGTSGLFYSTSALLISLSLSMLSRF